MLLDFYPVVNGVHVVFSIPQGIPAGIKEWVYFATDNVTTHDTEIFVPIEDSKAIADYTWSNFESQNEWQLTIGARDNDNKVWWADNDIYVTPLANGELSVKSVKRPVNTPPGMNITTTPASGSGPGIQFVIDEAATIYLLTEE
jgi:hypothetical protein